MYDRRTRNIEIFQDTERQCKTNEKLAAAIASSNEKQYIVQESDAVKVESGHRFSEPAKVTVSKKRSLEAAGAYKGEKVCVHNFASATNPGGGVTHGSSAQEEAICRCSTLYFNISEPDIVKGFHNRHRQLLKTEKMDTTYNDDCIYTPGVVVFKSDTDSPELLDETDWYQVDVITCAAPNLREKPSNPMNPDSGKKSVRIKDKDLKALHEKRMRHILDIAKKEKEDVVILGAFGCGAFSNSPYVVSEAMAVVIQDYLYDFRVIEFAVYCTPRDMKNYKVFSRRLKFE